MAGPLDPIRKDYLLADYLRDTNNQRVHKSVHVQAEAADPREETRWLQHIADSNSAGFPHGIVAQAHLHDPHLPKLLADYGAFKNVRGVRHLLNWHDTEHRLRIADRGDYLRDRSWREGYALLAKHRLSYDMHCLPNQAADAAEVIRTHPEVSVVVDHTGLDPFRTAESLARWEQSIRLYASIPHVHIKLSGLGMFDHHWTVESFRPYILRAIQGTLTLPLAQNKPTDATCRFASLISALGGGDDSVRCGSMHVRVELSGR